MPTFNFSFTVRAPQEAVARFHADTRTLRRLTPPPIFAQMHQVEPVAEGSVAHFTLWFGLLPVRWVAVHSGVDPQAGFTDTQARGPLRRWEHTHRFAPVDERATRVTEHIAYEHHAGLRGLLSRALFSRPALWALFTYRAWATGRALEGSST